MRSLQSPQKPRVGRAFVLVAVLVQVLAMKAGLAQDQAAIRLSVADDWTHHHVVFSGARTAADAQRMANDPRYLHQWLLHNRELPQEEQVSGSVELFPVPGMTSRGLKVDSTSRGKPKAPQSAPVIKLKEDWGSPLLDGGKVGDGMFPAKFTVDVNAEPSCTNDFVAYTTSIATELATASKTGSFGGGHPSAGNLVTVNGTVTLTASDSSNTGPFFLVSQADDVANATNLAAAIARNGSSAGVTASSSATTVTVTATAPGAAGNNITLAEGMGGFTWGNGGSLSGGVDGKPVVVAFNNLHSTQSQSLQGICGTGPSVLWSYSFGTGSVVTSPVLSLDGTKVMLVETKASGAVLHILQWKRDAITSAFTAEGTLLSPAAPAAVTNWSTCAAGASCVVNVAFNGAQPATTSAPFYDYEHDALYVGDDNGTLHKFSPVITGTPAEVTAGWPLTVNAGVKLGSPVLDSGSSKLFVGDASGTIHSVSSAISGTPSRDAFVSLGGTIVDAPIVDSSAANVFVFTNGNVYQFNTSLAGQTTATLAGGTSRAGAFDQKYFSSGTGNLFVCSGQTGHPTRAALYRIPITGGIMASQTFSDGVATTTSGSACSPVTELYNTTTRQDRVFFSIGATGTNASNIAECGGAGCVLSLDVTGAAWPPALGEFDAYAVPAATGASTSGILVDHLGETTAVPSTKLTGDMASIQNSVSVQNSITVVSSTGFNVNDYIQIDWEIMQITSVSIDGTTLGVSRGGYFSTLTPAHTTGTAVTGLRVALLTRSPTQTDTTITVDQHSTFAVGDYIQIDSEIMKIVDFGDPLLPATTTTVRVKRHELGSTAPPTPSHQANFAYVYDLGPYAQPASVYFSTLTNSTSGNPCGPGTIGVGCAVKLTQTGFK